MIDVRVQHNGNRKGVRKHFDERTGQRQNCVKNLQWQKQHFKSNTLRVTFLIVFNSTLHNSNSLSTDTNTL